MGDVAFVPERDILQSGDDGGAYEARQTGKVFAEDWVALVRHRGRALLAFGKELLDLEHFGALQVAYFGRETLDRTGDYGQSGETGGVPVAGDDLGRNEFDGEAHGLGDMRL